MDKVPDTHKERFLANDAQKTYRIEAIFEKCLWSTRFLVLFAVIACLISSVVLFVIGTIDVGKVVVETIQYYSGYSHGDLHRDVVGTVIGSIDIFLIAVVLMIFSFGLYELFISHIDVADSTESSNILDISSLDQLKDKLGQVIIMALIVRFFQELLSITFSSISELLLLAAGVAALSLALFFLHLGKKFGKHD